MASFQRELRARNGELDASRIPRQRASSRMRVSEAQRMRILSAMVEVASERGTECATVTQIVRHAGVSSGTFYALFENRQDCLTAMFEEAVAIASKRVCTAYDPEARWVDRVRAALLALLEFLDEEPELARLCVAHALASPAILTHRGELLDELTRIIDEGRSASGASRSPLPFAAHGVLGGTLGMIHARLISPDPRSLVELVNPLMSMAVLPYLGASAARREQYRPLPVRRSVRKRRPTGNPLAGLGVPLTYRTLRVLGVVAAEPGLSNCEVSERAGITDQGQISRLLARLARLGLTKNTGKGRPNVWILTRKGKELLRTVESLR
jgi:AcrR family transcriptional regulator/DNA-binding MarR family transcriptional regulator